MIFLEGNFPSFKNSKQFTGKFFIMSKTVQKYLKAWEWQWVVSENAYRSISVDMVDCWMDNPGIPLNIGIHFVRGTKHKYDWVNMVQGVQDLMVKHKWIPDDNVDVMLPFPIQINGCFSSYDKNKPGVFINIIK